MIVNRVLIYVTLTAMLVLTYIASVVALQALFHFLTGQASQLVVVLSTLAAVALFNPLRHRIQTLINHRFREEQS